MKNRLLTGSFVALAIFSLIIGYTCSSKLQHDLTQKPSKTMAGMAVKKALVSTDTRVIHEKEYTRCHHVVVTGFNDRNRIIGLDQQGLKQYFKKEQGYSLTFSGDILIIHQSIDSFCPEEQGQFKLKEHQGYVAVYTGAEENEILLRVTAIRLELLPDTIQKDIRQGQYSFEDEDSLNDTLENLDEYI